MSQELGRIERPTAAAYEGSRKLFLVPLVYSPTEPPADYVGILERFWAGARNQIRRLADRTSTIARIYHEAVSIEGEEGLKLIERISPRSHTLIMEWVQSGAKIQALEDADTFYETIDWQRCLMSGLASRKVMETVLNSYREATHRRFEQMTQRIDQTLGAGESGLLLMPEDHSLQFPKDIQVFYIAPPALDEVHRWLRERQEQGNRAATEAEDEELK